MNDTLVVTIDEAVHETCPAGTYNAVCAMVHRLGKHKGFNDGPPVEKVGLIFEVEVGQPSAGSPAKTYQLCKTVNLTFNEKSGLRQILMACRGGDLTGEERLTRSVDLNTLIGKPCTIAVINRVKGDRTVAVIDVVTNHMAGMRVMQPTVDRSKVPEWVTRFRQNAVVLQAAVSSMPSMTV